MDKEIVKRIADEARDEEANLIVWDERDTFTVEPKAEVSVEDMAVGRYVVIQGRSRRFFGMITDVRLSAANGGVLHAEIAERNLGCLGSSGQPLTWYFAGFWRFRELLIQSEYSYSMLLNI